MPNGCSCSCEFGVSLLVLAGLQTWTDMYYTPYKLKFLLQRIYLEQAELMNPLSKRLHDSFILTGILNAYIHVTYPCMVKAAAVSTIHVKTV
jgi:hypothetical protein